MNKKESILFAHSIVKAASYPATTPADFRPAMSGNEMAFGVGGQAINGLWVPGAYRSAQTAANGARPTAWGVAGKFGDSMLGTGGSMAGKVLGRGFVGLDTAMNAYGAGSAAMDARKDYNNSGFRNGGIAGAAGWAGTTAGMNRTADIAQNGGLGLAGTAIGAGIGAMAGGVGALPGAVVGGIVGGAAQLGVGGYRAATGWDPNKYNQAKQLSAGLSSQGAAGIVGQALQNKNGGGMFKSKTLFGGTRDLGAEAELDEQKGNAFQKNLK